MNGEREITFSKNRLKVERRKSFDCEFLKFRQKSPLLSCFCLRFNCPFCWNKDWIKIFLLSHYQDVVNIIKIDGNELILGFYGCWLLIPIFIKCFRDSTFVNGLSIKWTCQSNGHLFIRLQKNIKFKKVGF